MSQTDETITELERLSEKIAKCRLLRHTGDVISDNEAQAVDSAIVIMRETQRESKAALKV